MLSNYVTKGFFGMMTSMPMKIVDPTDKHPFYVVDGQDHERVTTVIDAVMGGPKSNMAYWGAELMSQYVEGRLLDTEWDYPAEEWYEDFKATPLNPNAVRDKAADRGKRAHTLFEDLVLGNATCTTNDDGSPVWVKHNDEEHAYAVESYDLGVVKAYREIALGIDGLLPEQRVFSKTHRFAGTADLIGGSLVADVKTHKPPARFTDFVQMAAYSLAWEEMTGQVIDAHMAILPHEDGTYTAYHSFVDPQVFIDVLNIYREQRNWKVVTA